LWSAERSFCHPSFQATERNDALGCIHLFHATNMETPQYVGPIITNAFLLLPWLGALLIST
jgi:hypothetical protein